MCGSEVIKPPDSKTYGITSCATIYDNKNSLL